MRKEILLSGNDWGLFRFKPGEGEQLALKWDFWQPASTWNYGMGWLRADVPGDIHSTLMKRKIIPDQRWGMNNEICRWVGEYEWWYKKRLYIPHDWRTKGRHIRLVFDGVDYDARFWANEQYLGSHQGMFSPIVFDVTQMARQSGYFDIAVCIAPPPKYRKEIGGRKCNLSYGVDYTPILATMGIWKDVRAVCTGETYINDCFITSQIGKNEAVVHIEMETVNASNGAKNIKYEIQITGKNFASPIYRKVVAEKLEPGRKTIGSELAIPAPNLWWPWDRGAQNLYNVQVKLFDGEEESDIFERPFGIRTIEMTRNAGSSEDSCPFTFAINGKREYIRGANWTNADLLPENLKADRYASLLKMVKEANINMLRVHGWHIIEKREFYDLCDELGILVWQEFMFCNMDYPQDEEYIGKVEDECRHAIKSIRNHPSLAVWCSGNEIVYGPNKKLIDTLQMLGRQNDPGRPFLPVSDMDRCYGLEWGPSHTTIMNEGKKKGDFHNWSVWHEFAPITDYTKDQSLFTGEFGIQAVPDIESLRKFIPEDELWPPGYAWEYHYAELDKLAYYAYYIKSGTYTRGIKPEQAFKTLEEFVDCSQRAQAEALKFGIEHHRSRKYCSSGTLFWAFNEPWPAVIGSIVDWYLRPKKAYYAVKDAYSPLLVALQHGKKEWKRDEEFEGDIWIVNDYLDMFNNCCLEIKAIDNKDNLLKKEILKIEKIKGDSADKVFVLKWLIARNLDGEFHILLQLNDSEGSALTKNRYKFRIIDI